MANIKMAGTGQYSLLIVALISTIGKALLPNNYPRKTVNKSFFSTNFSQKNMYIW